MGTATAVDSGEEECSLKRFFHLCRASLSLDELRLVVDGWRDVGGAGGGVGEASLGNTQLLSFRGRAISARHSDPLLDEEMVSKPELVSL